MVRNLPIMASSISTKSVLANEETLYACGYSWSQQLFLLCPGDTAFKPIKKQISDFSYRYVDIHTEGISKASLEQTVGKPVDTILQIFVDKTHIGGSNDYEKYVQEMKLIITK